MSVINQDDIKTVLDGIVLSAREELYATAQSELDKYYHFQYDNTKSREWNIYKFNDRLDLYKRQCRQWEEHHNGSSCVVERVRDTYLMPKIKQFLIDLDNHEQAKKST
jgi:hypothetical protein